MLHTIADYLYKGNISNLLATPIQQLDIDTITPTHLKRYHVTKPMLVGMNDECNVQYK